MYKPNEFCNKEELIGYISQKKKDLSKWFENRCESLDDIITASVKGNTFRAFPNMPRKPSKVFRGWASEQLNNKDRAREFMCLSSEQQYDQWVREFSKSFHYYWEKEMGTQNSIGYGPSRKLPNLLLKHLVLWKQIRDNQRKRLIKLLHVPLDRFTLVAIRNCICDFTEFEVIGLIRKDVGMSFVDTEKKYNAIQQIMRAIAKRAGTPAIYIDILVWNKQHS